MVIGGEWRLPLSHSWTYTGETTWKALISTEPFNSMHGLRYTHASALHYLPDDAAQPIHNTVYANQSSQVITSRFSAFQSVSMNLHACADHITASHFKTYTMVLKYISRGTASKETMEIHWGCLTVYPHACADEHFFPPYHTHPRYTKTSFHKVRWAKNWCEYTLGDFSISSHACAHQRFLYGWPLACADH